MKAWRCENDGLFRRDLDRPRVRPQSVLVRIEATTLVSYFRSWVRGELPGYFPPRRPFTPGMNGIGTVEETGPGVYGLAPGDRVLLSGYATAAENVPEPAEALLSLTADPDAHGLADDWPDGTLAEYALVPASTVTPVPAGLRSLPAERLAVLTRCLVPFGGLLRARLSPGETVIVNGATGSFGGAAVWVALALGAGEVVATGRNRELLEARFGAVGRVRTVVTGGDLGPADCALDMIGGADRPDSTLAVLAALRRGGRLVLMGSMTAPLPIDYLAVMLARKEILGAFMYPPEAPGRLMRLAAAGHLDLDAIPAEVFGPGDLEPAMDRAAEPGAPLVVIGGPG